MEGAGDTLLDHKVLHLREWVLHQASGGKGVCSYELDYKLCYLWSKTRIMFKMSAAWWSCQYHQSGDSLSGPLGCGKWREHI